MGGRAGQARRSAPAVACNPLAAPVLTRPAASCCLPNALHSTNVFTHHGGSPLRLLGLLLVGDFFIFGMLYHLTTRLSFVWTCVALPLAVLLPVRSGGGTEGALGCMQAWQAYSLTTAAPCSHRQTGLFG